MFGFGLVGVGGRIGDGEFHVESDVGLGERGIFAEGADVGGGAQVLQRLATGREGEEEDREQAEDVFHESDAVAVV